MVSEELSIPFSKLNKIAHSAARTFGAHPTAAVYDQIISDVLYKLWKASKQEGHLSNSALYRIARLGVVDGMRSHYGRNRRHHGHVSSDALPDNNGLDVLLVRNPTNNPPSAKKPEGIVDNLLKRYPPKGSCGERNADMIQQYIEGDPMWRIGETYGCTESRVSQIVKTWTDQVKTEGGTTLGLAEFDVEDYSALMSEPLS